LANYNSSSITRGDPGRGGVYEKTTIGVVNFGAVTLATADTISLCQIPYGCYVSGCYFWFPILATGGALTLALVDTLASPTTYIPSTTASHTAVGGAVTNFQAASVLSFLDFAPATVGTMYGSTARAIAASGCAVVPWLATAWNTAVPNGVGLVFNVVAGGTGAITANAKIEYVVQFAPNYDQGV
jgi:hypothetical protein